MKLFPALLSRIVFVALCGAALVALLALPLAPAFADGPTITINSFSPGTSLMPGQTLSFTAVGGGTLTSNVTYLVFDSFTNSSLTASHMGASTGVFSWVPTQGDLGTHVLTIEALNGTGLVAIVEKTITVGTTVASTPASLSVQGLSPGTVVSIGQGVTFVAVPTGFSAASYTVSDSFPANTLTNANINAFGSFSWIPSASEIGSHTITITAKDSAGVATTATVTVQVNPAGTTTPAPAILVPTPVAPVTTSATVSSSLSNIQLQAIVAVLQAFGVSQATIQKVLLALAGTVAAPTASATVTGKYLFTSFLTSGASGTEVTELQKRLTVLGFYTDAITGKFEASTTAAVKKFQAARGIAQLGYVGPSTRTALNEN
ncbi:MAG: peptidoglycan-binding protein [Patescibacteria group bacterium]